MRTIPTNVSRSSLAIIPSRCWVSTRSKHLQPLTLNVLLCTWSWIVWINTQCSSTVIEFQIQWQCTSIKLCSYNFWTAFIQFYPSVALLFAPLTSPPACQTWQSGCLSGVLSARLSYRSVERPTCFLSTSTSAKKKKTSRGWLALSSPCLSFLHCDLAFGLPILSMALRFFCSRQLKPHCFPIRAKIFLCKWQMALEMSHIPWPSVN